MESLTDSVAVKLSYMILLSLCTLAGTDIPGEANLFLSRQKASEILVHQRLRRANSMLEELKLGDLERECLEETCSYEEAREIFNHPEQLNEFWKAYSEADQCESGPCLNGATCVDQMNAYICICPVGFEGRVCGKAKVTSYGCLYKNGGCEQFCTEYPDLTRSCHCARGYKLAKDNSSCLPQVPFPCGRPAKAFVPRIVKGEECPKGECPWQAMLEYMEEYQCGAIVLAPQWALTAAHCVWRKDVNHLVVTGGEHNRTEKEGTEQVRPVARLIIHPQYNHSTYDFDLALLKLKKPWRLGPDVVPVCLPALDGSFERTLATVRTSVVSGWGRLAPYGPPSTMLLRLEVPRVPLQECQAHSGLNLTRNMLCAGFREGGRDACKGDSGGPLVTLYKHTWFLTGVVSWGKGCAREDFYGIYTRVANFLVWIDRTMLTS